MKLKQITLNDIAKKLNVSTVTVSKALRNHPDISFETKKLIKKISEEMGYSPNILARNLSARKSNAIGVIVPKIAHYFFGAIIEKIYNIAFENNYEIILTVSQEKAEIEKKHIQTLLSMRVDGLIISITQQTNDYSVFESLLTKGVPVVFIDRIPPLPNINSVEVDDRGGAYKAVEHAIKIGYKKIGHFAGYLNVNIGKERIAGFKQAMNDYGVEINPDWIIEGGFGDQYGYEAFMKLYNEKNLPDIIFTVTYPVALGVYKAAREVGMKIPDDIDVICFGYADVQEFLHPPLSCVDQPTDKIAEKAMELIFERINNPEETTAKHVLIDTNLILRGTCNRTVSHLAK